MDLLNCECKRTSDISTTDFNSDSDEIVISEGINNKLEDPDTMFQLFDNITDEQKCTYTKLRKSLEIVYLDLEQEIEPVCVRDQCTLIPKFVELSCVSNSMMKKRRLSSLNSDSN